MIEEKPFLITLGNTSDLNTILIKSIEKTFDSKFVLDHLIFNMVEGDAVKIYKQAKEHLKNSYFAPTPILDIKKFYANLNDISDVSSITEKVINDNLTDIITFDDLMNKKTSKFIKIFTLQTSIGS